MIAKQQLESEIRRLRRAPVRVDLRDRVLAAAASGTSAGGHTGRARQFWSWRFAGVLVALVIVIAAGIWTVRSTPPARPANPPAAQQIQVTRAPGDDIVVFWLDDETPVLVSLAEGR